MAWWVATLAASFILAIQNALMRVFQFTPAISFALLPFIILVPLIYWYGFRNAPNFIACWFLGVGASSIAGVIIGILFLKETITLKVLLGMILTAVGSFLLISV